MEENTQHFLDLIRRSHRGRFKIYIGMIAGVGKTYRMLQDAREMLRQGTDVQIGFVETHGRPDTVKALKGLPVIPRKRVFYKGKEIEEMDLDAILQVHPEIVIVDELAHTNVEGCRHAKRWQDVMELLEAGINVISAVNIQHIESLNDEVRKMVGVDVKERIPDSVLREADEVVNIDLTAEELVERLKAGKIYAKEKIQTALDHFFQTGNILQLRELALREVAFRVGKKVEEAVPPRAYKAKGVSRIVVCVSSNTWYGVSRRDWRDGAGATVEAVACARNGRVCKGGRHKNHPRRCAHPFSHQPQSKRRNSQWAIPRGSLLPTFRVPHPFASTASTSRLYPFARPAFH